MNYYRCSDGSKVSEATIQKKLSESYRETYTFNPKPYCMGCGKQAAGSAHIIPRARLKEIGRTELIWNPIMYFPACHSCNSKIEGYKGDFKSLKNWENCLKIMKIYDSETYNQFTSYL